MDTLRCGAAKAEITPPFDMYMGGYACRREQSHGVHDPLFVRALAVECGSTAAIILSYDLLAVDGMLATGLDSLRATPEFGGAKPIMLPVATHTHYGPDGFPPEMRFGEWGGEPYAVPEYRELLLRRSFAAVVSAWSDLRPCDMFLGYGRADFGLNRRDPDGDRCDRVTSLRFVPKGDMRRTVASVIHYTCHPTVMNRREATFSADFPGVACAIEEDRIGGCCLFVNGACGDVSTRFSRRGEGPEEALRFGAVLAGAVQDAELNERMLEPKLSVIRSALPFGDRRVPAAKLIFGGNGGIRAILLPAEIFASTANGWHEKYGNVIVWGYALDYAGYVPDKAGFAAGGYEVESALISEAEADIFLYSAEMLIKMERK